MSPTYPSLPPRLRTTQAGRGGGIRTPTSGFGDRRSTVEPTPLYPELGFSNQPQFLFFPPAFYFDFPLASSKLIRKPFAPNEPNRSAFRGERGSNSPVMFPNPLLDIRRNPDVQRTVPALHHVAEPGPRIGCQSRPLSVDPSGVHCTPSGQAGGLPLNLLPFTPSHRRGVYPASSG